VARVIVQHTVKITLDIQAKQYSLWHRAMLILIAQ
jgi:hypothetical protein